ncbi:hypothetical protein AAVH_24062 [Aphelenchoides avenae]|nr:hypothetical protein AAVH_24062 [Aphelenchus avenae]
MSAYVKSTVLLLVLAVLIGGEEDIPPGQVRVENLDTGDVIFVPWQTKNGKKAVPPSKRSGGRHKRLSFDPTGLSVDAKDGQNVDIAYESGKGGWEVAGVGVY